MHERKHKIVKRWAVPLCIAGRKRGYERTLLEECTLAHLKSLKEPLVKPCLLEPVQAHPKAVAALRAAGFASAASALTARTARVQSRSIVVGDVVLYLGDDHSDIRVGEVYFHASCGGELLTCLSHWPVSQETSKWKKVVVMEEFSIVPSACLLQSVIFSPAKVGKKATVLMPAL